MNYGYEDGTEGPPLGPEDESHRSFIQMYARALQPAGPVGGQDVLEVGCGRGGGSAWIARTRGPRSMVGVDQAGGAIALCRTLHAAPNLRFEKGDAECLPLPDGSFDLVLNVESCHHYPSLISFFDEVERVLRPGGRFCLATYWEPSKIDGFRHALQETTLEVIETEDITAHVVRSLRATNAMKLTFITQQVPWFLKWLLRRFAGVEGSEIHRGFEDGRIRYVAATLRKRGAAVGGSDGQPAVDAGRSNDRGRDAAGAPASGDGQLAVGSVAGVAAAAGARASGSGEGQSPAAPAARAAARSGRVTRPEDPAGSAAQDRASYWRSVVAPYEGPDDRRSAAQLATTALLYIAAWPLLLWSLEIGYWLTAVLALPAAGLVARLFVIQHDCGHGSYFRSQRLANAVGFIIGVLMATPYHYWRTNHARHHARSGDLDARDFGDIATLTVAEYRARTPWRQFLYRVYRNPVLLVGVSTTFHFVVLQRFPWSMPRTWKREWRSVWWTNAALAALVAASWFTVGVGPVLLIQGTLMAYTCALAGWITHVQHQFEDAYWRRSDAWDFHDAALQGASWLVLPKPLQWFTASIGLHHIHHLSSRIPNYRLQRCVDENPALQRARRITWRDGLRSLHLALWDEERGRLISFREHRRLARTGAGAGPGADASSSAPPAFGDPSNAVA